MSPAPALAGRQQILRVDATDGKRWLTLPARRASRNGLVAALQESPRDSLWILPTRACIASLLDAVHQVLQQSPPQRRLGRLLVLEPARASAAPVLHSLFEPVVGTTAEFRHLPWKQLLDVLDRPDEVVRDLLIGGWSDPRNELVTLVRGDLRTLVAPSPLFRPARDATPNFRRLAFDDHGHTVRLGRYEAASDAILYELDSDFRRRLNASRRASERGFGPALRRLRKQRGLSRSDFPGVSEKTIARIERGEIRRPHPRTLRALESRFGLTRREIATF